MALETLTVPVQGTVLRTPQTATIFAASLHGSNPSYPAGFTHVSSNAVLPPPSAPPVMVAVGNSGPEPGTYWVSYAWASDAAGLNVTTPSPPVSFTVPDLNNSFRGTPATPPPGAHAAVWYIGNATTRYRFAVRTPPNLVTYIEESAGNTEFPESLVNLSAAPSLVFGRSDDESGNYPVPIPQGVPTTAFSWYKSIQLVVPTGGTGNTFISNVAIAKSGREPNGVGLFYRVVPVYTRCVGIPGLPIDTVGNPSGRYPSNDLSPHAGQSANTPAGYVPVPLSPIVVATGPYWAGDVGDVGPVIQIVCGITDRETMLLPPGWSSLPSVQVYYDEI